MKVINAESLPTLRSSNKGRPTDAAASKLASEVIAALSDGAEVVALTASDLRPIGADDNTVESQIGTFKRAIKRLGGTVKIDRPLEGEGVFVRQGKVQS